MEPERARDLLARERARIERALRIHAGEPLESDQNVDPGSEGDEYLYQDEMDEGRADELRRDLAAVERAEQRLRDGTYGISIVSGEPIPEARLEARPTAEMTVEEQQRAGG